MAASIEETFGFRPELIEGHDGIYEIALNDRVLYTNRGKCRQFPTNDEILIRISSYKKPISGKEQKIKMVFPMLKNEH